ncbi:MAG: hypothetical protein EBU59_07565 [Planctomycetia bacterium]|nr:hypothetical protein [Planctomycetia bacterium]
MVGQILSRVVGLILFVATVIGWQAARAGGDTARPHIVILYADDLGYGDLQCYNPDRGKIPTPQIDRLAQEGMRLLVCRQAL